MVWESVRDRDEAAPGGLQLRLYASTVMYRRPSDKCEDVRDGYDGVVVAAVGRSSSRRRRGTLICLGGKRPKARTAGSMQRVRRGSGGGRGPGAESDCLLLEERRRRETRREAEEASLARRAVIAGRDESACVGVPYAMRTHRQPPWSRLGAPRRRRDRVGRAEGYAGCGADVWVGGVGVCAEARSVEERVWM